jgi:hypothetical protein
MEQYNIMAGYYDVLMEDVDYKAWEEYLGELFTLKGKRPTKVFDIACGTGNITIPLSKNGYIMTGLDISTVSRVANSKYIQTHFGIFPLKYFFSEGLQTDSGEEVSTREIKKILQECIDSETKRRPLTDERLTEILQEKGYQIARRTVAKYREQLNIPVARLRKEI